MLMELFMRSYGARTVIWIKDEENTFCIILLAYDWFWAKWPLLQIKSFLKFMKILIIICFSSTTSSNQSIPFFH